jgi:hypothetical protein
MHALAFRPAAHVFFDRLEFLHGIMQRRGRPHPCVKLGGEEVDRDGDVTNSLDRGFARGVHVLRGRVDVDVPGSTRVPRSLVVFDRVVADCDD